MIYLIGNEKNNICKIGVSKYPLERLKALKTSFPFDLKLIDEVSLNNAYEKVYHLFYKEKRIEREWFDYSKIGSNALRVEQVELLKFYFNHLFNNKKSRGYISKEMDVFSVSKQQLINFGIDEERIHQKFKEIRSDKLKRGNLDNFLEFLPEGKVKHAIKTELFECINKRSSNGITQEDVSKYTGKSLATIKRFENGKVDSLFLYCYYIETFKELPNRKKKTTPKWVFR